MSKKLLTNLEDYVIFAHKDNQNNAFAMTKAEHLNYTKEVSKYGMDNELVPDGITIKAFPIGIVNEKREYDICSPNSIDFPINKIYWIFIAQSKL